MTLFAWHTHDAPWHVYNLYQLSRVFPPELPGFSNSVLRNYHMFSDLFWGGILRLVPVVDPVAYLPAYCAVLVRGPAGHRAVFGRARLVRGKPDRVSGRGPDPGNLELRVSAPRCCAGRSIIFTGIPFSGPNAR